MAPTTAPLIINSATGMVPLLIREEMKQLGVKEVAITTKISRDIVTDERATFLRGIRYVLPKLSYRYLYQENLKKPNAAEVKQKLEEVLRQELTTFVLLILYHEDECLFTIYDMRFGAPDKPIKSPRLDRALRKASEQFKGFVLPDRFDEMVKDLNTKLNPTTVYIHMTSRFIGAAYRAMEITGKVTSCMSHANTEYFKRDLPPCLYENSLPLALVLVSKYSVDDPRYVENCPYVARALARVDRDFNIVALSRIYCTNAAVVDALNAKYVNNEKTPFIGLELKGFRESVPYIDIGLGLAEFRGRLYLNAWGEDGNTFGAINLDGPDDEDFDEYCGQHDNWSEIDQHNFACGICGHEIRSQQRRTKAVTERFGITFETIAHQYCADRQKGNANEQNNVTVQAPLEWPETVEDGSEAGSEVERETEKQASNSRKETNDPVSNYEAAA